MTDSRQESPGNICSGSSSREGGDVHVWLGLFHTIIIALHIDFLLEQVITFLCSLSTQFPSIRECELVKALLEEQDPTDGSIASVRQIRQTAETFRLSMGELLDSAKGDERPNDRHSSTKLLKSRPNLSSSTLGFDQGVHPDPDDCAAAQCDQLFSPASVVVDEDADDPGDEWGHFAYYNEEEDDYGDSTNQHQYLRQPLEKVDELLEEESS